MAQTGNGGKASAGELHQSQCDAADSAWPEPSSGLPAEATPALQMPPSLPVRTSSASRDTGASSAASTARKAQKAPRRALTDKGGRMAGQENTGRL